MERTDKFCAQAPRCVQGSLKKSHFLSLRSNLMHDNIYINVLPLANVTSVTENLFSSTVFCNKMYWRFSIWRFLYTKNNKTWLPFHKSLYVNALSNPLSCCHHVVYVISYQNQNHVCDMHCLVKVGTLLIT